MNGSLRDGFSRFLDADPDRLHIAAHSHHPWPDVTATAQQRAWDDANELADHKWERVFDQVLPETQRWIARRLGTYAPDAVAIAPNTHELFTRILSCLEPPARILATAGEFSSFERQVRRLAEDGLVAVTRVPVEPVTTLSSRMAEAAAGGGHDLVYVSHVLYETGAVVDIDSVVGAVPDDRTFVVIDGYHRFMALPIDLGALADRVFYLAGGYKYAMAGEGVCFAHCPPGYGPRPRDTGWFADFGGLADGADVPTRNHGPDGAAQAAHPGRAEHANSPDDSQKITYGPGGRRFLGATFDPTALYRFNAVQQWLDDCGTDVAAIHDHVSALQRRFLSGLADVSPTLLGDGRPAVAPPATGGHGHILTFDVSDAAAVTATLRHRNVVVDHRGRLVRFGFGVYHDPADVDRLLDRLGSVAPT